VFPLRDENPTLLTPTVTVVLILANVAVWVYVQGMGFEAGVLGESICRFGAFPAAVAGTVPEGAGRAGSGHAGLRAGQAAVRGRCDEHVPAWQLAASHCEHVVSVALRQQRRGFHGPRPLPGVLPADGVLATGAHILSAPDSLVPVVGASGAISALMGGYLLLFPRVRIHTLFIFVIILRIIPVPAWFVLVLWFALQLLSGYADPMATSGVAFWAHVGGFVAGVVLIKLFETAS
jgi:membrane associated rhomboid family serine protease